MLWQCTSGWLVPYVSRQHAELHEPWRQNHHTVWKCQAPVTHQCLPHPQRAKTPQHLFLCLLTVVSLLTICHYSQTCHVLVLSGFTTSCDSNIFQQHCFICMCSCSLDMIYITDYIWYQYKAMRVQHTSVKLASHEQFLHLCHSNSSSDPYAILPLYRGIWE